MERLSVLCLFLLCSLSGAELLNNEITEQREARPESVNEPEHPQALPSDVHAVLQEMSAKLAENKLMIQQLQTLNQEQAAKLKEQTSEVDALRLQQEEHATKLRELQTREVDSLKKQLRDQAAELNSMKAQTNMTQYRVNSLRRDRIDGRVAFSASLVISETQYMGPFNTHTPVIFRHVISNMGNAYNPNSGFFTAPVRGVYHFQFYILSDSARASWVYLTKNGVNVVSAYERQQSGWGSASNGATLHLVPGDVVFVRLWPNTRIYDDGSHYSTFSGHLLFPL